MKGRTCFMVKYTSYYTFASKVEFFPILINFLYLFFFLLALIAYMHGYQAAVKDLVRLFGK
jgi:hypothetical protein